MWLLTNETPFAAASTWTRDERGAELAGRDPAPVPPSIPRVRTSPLFPRPRSPAAPVFADDPATTGIIQDCDLYLDKKHTDVLVSGHAYTRDTAPAERTRSALRSAISTNPWSSLVTASLRKARYP